MTCTVCHCSVEVCDGHHDRALDPCAPRWSESTACEGRRLRDAQARAMELKTAIVRCLERAVAEDIIAWDGFGELQAHVHDGIPERRAPSRVADK